MPDLTRQESRATLVLRAAPWVSAPVLGLLLFHRLATSILRDTSWLHVEKALIFFGGHPFYTLPGSGPVISAFYGPLSIAPYFPVVFMPTLETMMFMAQGITMVLFFLPAVLIFEGERRREGGDTAPAAAFFIFSFSVFFISSLRDTAFLVRADASALCYSGLAVLGLYFRRRSDADTALVLSALAGVCAVWSKQIALPILFVLPVYAALSEGRAACLKILFWQIVWGCALTALFCRIFGAPELLFNLVTVFGRHPWREGAVVSVLLKILREAAWVAVPGFVAWRCRDGALAGNRWRLVLLTALFFLPSAFLGKIKVGGSNNAVSYLTYFLLLAACLYLARLRSERSKRGLAVLAVGMLIVQAAAVGIKYSKPMVEDNFIATAHRYAKAHPGEAYFPRLNAVTLVAEGRVYPDSDAIIDREWAGLPPTRHEREDFLPPHLSVMAFHKGSSDDMTRFQLKGSYSHRMEMDELPGFWVYRIAEAPSDAR